MSSHNAEQREIEAEQSYVDTVYERLDASAKVAQSLVVEGMARGHVGNEGGLVERDAMVYQATKRLSALNAAHDGLVFGRLNMLDGDSRYIGRIGVRDADREILLIDWRAPAAAVFYQATAQEPAGVVRRRVLRCANDQVIGVEDDLLDADNAPDDMVIVGEGALLASLTRARDTSMHSVVATIQKEQDEAIRAPGRGATTIGGGPGTGKTVVALHRAAYLLYTDRRRFESGGVLVVGPSNVFMNYIERVLPSLGETSVTLRSLGEVVDGIRAGRHDEPVAAAAKGSSRMTGFLKRAAAAPLAGSPTEFRYFYKDDVLRLQPQQLDKIRRQLLSNARRNRAYAQVPAVLVDALWRQVRGERALEKGREDFVEIVTTDDRFIDFVEQWWPPVEPIEIWRTLPDLVDELSNGTFSRAEIAALKASWVAGEPSIQDVPLIDELRYLVGEVPEANDDDDDAPKQLMSFERREREDRVDRNRTTQSIEDDGFAHVLVDEAQDLSPMQWRMLGRRGRHASWTIVGDEAQSSWPHPLESAAARKDALDGKPEHAFRLSTNYRNSAEIYDLAAKVAAIGVPDPDLADAVRRTGEQPKQLVVPPADLVDTARASALEVLDRVEGTVAIVAARAAVDRLRDDLADLLAEHPDRLRVLDGLDTKGLEFDAVVVVEPDAITDESSAGWRTLYVVLTRATQLLTTVGTTDRWSNRIA
ncbi:HelD family protein [Aeromicrobium wangtongii]|uniref:AAA family ATPase n=1 Tax=Aeromicrobium wangtongii TaxID=2969247 RepID=A0ABY5M918_9ACTN|nr:UvrD-helicase domain-containing protein [Aeromicrobium wangtongii]MCD9199997.1 AAA family ATPase [Aeromicrobium wangtongii]UUP13614.1 AAA family ATPase [Aeromicrobium wangtongii]